jgi:hypothetical protein
MCVSGPCKATARQVQSADECCGGTGASPGSSPGDTHLYCNPVPNCTPTGSPPVWPGGSDCCGGRLYNDLCASLYCVEYRYPVYDLNGNPDPSGANCCAANGTMRGPDPNDPQFYCN